MVFMRELIPDGNKCVTGDGEIEATVCPYYYLLKDDNDNYASYCEFMNQPIFSYIKCCDIGTVRRGED